MSEAGGAGGPADSGAGARWVPVGPDRLGLALDASPDRTGPWVVRRLRTATGLNGPPGVLHGGLTAGVLLGAARLEDRFGAPPTAVDARLRAPTPMEAAVATRVQPLRAGVHEVQIVRGDDVLVSGTVTLAGHEVAPRVADLQSLAGRAEPESLPVAEHPAPTCFVCGADNPRGLRMLPGVGDGWVVARLWAQPQDAGDDGSLHPVMVCAVLDCPALWAVWGQIRAGGWRAAVTGGLHVRFFGAAPVGEVLRVVAKADDHTEGSRRFGSRAALLGEDGTVYATSAVAIVAVDAARSGPPPA